MRPKQQRAGGRYTFGDGDLAERRLEEFGAFFNRAAEVFLKRHVRHAPGTVVDLGCGPGFTTQMLASVFGASRVAGLDVSVDFLRRAAQRLPSCRFELHDVRSTPFPLRPDLAYSRFLLSHIPDAVTLVDRWTRVLAPGGLLVLDELEEIETEVAVFRRYLEINTQLIASQGADLWVGRALREATWTAPVLANEAVRLPVPNARAAAWFRPNTVTVWRREPSLARWLGEQERDGIAEQLARIRDGGEQGHAVWIMRRLLLAAPDRC